VRKWLRDPPPQIPGIPQITEVLHQTECGESARGSAEVANGISGISGISGLGHDDHLLPDTPPPASGSIHKMPPAANMCHACRAQDDDWSIEDWQALFDERVGIATFDGGLPGPAAEARALDECVAEWLWRTSNVSPSGPCPICGDVDRPNDPLLAIGIIGGRTWLHIGCVKAWCTARKAEAVSALASMGIGKPQGGST